MPKYVFMSVEGFTRVETLPNDKAAEERAEFLQMGWKHLYTPKREANEVARAIRFTECKKFEKNFTPPAWWSQVRGRRG